MFPVPAPFGAAVVKAAVAGAIALTAPHAATATVQAGQSLTTIAAAHDVSWPSLYDANAKTIGINPDQIEAGMVLTLPPRGTTGGWLPAPPSKQAQPQSATTGPQAAPEPAAPTTPAPGPAATPTPAHVSQGLVSTAGMPAIEACIVTRESGGQPQVMNSSGHYGLFQFDLPTWESGGGSAADFGDATVAEQEQVFANVYAARGVEPWQPSDGC